MTNGLYIEKMVKRSRSLASHNDGGKEKGVRCYWSSHYANR